MTTQKEEAEGEALYAIARLHNMCAEMMGNRHPTRTQLVDFVEQARQRLQVIVLASSLAGED